MVVIGRETEKALLSESILKGKQFPIFSIFLFLAEGKSSVTELLRNIVCNLAILKIISLSQLKTNLQVLG